MKRVVKSAIQCWIDQTLMCFLCFIRCVMNIRWVADGEFNETVPTREVQVSAKTARVMQVHFLR